MGFPSGVSVLYKGNGFIEKEVFVAPFSLGHIFKCNYKKRLVSDILLRYI
jgi:hypothetical protein